MGITLARVRQTKVGQAMLPIRSIAIAVITSVLAALMFVSPSLAKVGKKDAKTVAKAVKDLGIDPEKTDPYFA